MVQQNFQYFVKTNKYHSDFVFIFIKLIRRIRLQKVIIEALQ